MTAVPDPSFTDDDAMNPVYCRQCRVQIPGELHRRSAGLFTPCLTALEERAERERGAAAEAAEALRLRLAARQARRDALLRSGGSAWLAPLVFLVLAVTIAAYHVTVVRPLRAELAAVSADLERAKDNLSTVQSALQRTTESAENANEHAHSHPDL